MERIDRGNLLRVEQERDGIAIEVKGTEAEILRNWAIITNEICERLHEPPVMLAAMLPGMVSAVRSGTTWSVRIDQGIIQKAQEGGHGAGK